MTVKAEHACTQIRQYVKASGGGRGLDKREEVQNTRGRAAMARMDNWEVSTS